MSKLSKLSYFFVTFLFFVIFDFYLSGQILKYGWKLPENTFIDFIFIQNEGAAFSILQNYKTFLILFALLAIVGIIIYIIKHIENLSFKALFCTSLLCSGIFCNLYERIVFGYVRDFIKLNFIDFPIFNISDIFINLSVLFIVIIIIKNNYFKKS